MIGSVGLRVHRRFALDDVALDQFVPEVWARYAHEFGDRDREVSARISGATMGGRFRVVSAETGRDGAIFGIGWSVSRADTLSFLFHYELGWNPDLLNHAVAVGALIRW